MLELKPLVVQKALESRQTSQGLMGLQICTLRLASDKPASDKQQSAPASFSETSGTLLRLGWHHIQPGRPDTFLKTSVVFDCAQAAALALPTFPGPEPCDAGALEPDAEVRKETLDTLDR